MTATDRNNRIDAVVALCVKSDIHPHKNCFVGFARRILTSKFYVSEPTAKADVNTLVDAWRGNRWRSIIKENSYLTEEEKQAWNQNY